MQSGPRETSWEKNEGAIFLRGKGDYSYTLRYAHKVCFCLKETPASVHLGRLPGLSTLEALHPGPVLQKPSCAPRPSDSCAQAGNHLRPEDENTPRCPSRIHSNSPSRFCTQTSESSGGRLPPHGLGPPSPHSCPWPKAAP